MNNSDLARDIMVTRLVTLRPEMHVFDGIGHLLKRNITGAPVVDSERNFLGVFSEKCCMSVLTLTARLACEGEKHLVRCLHAKDIMATRLLTLTPEMDVFDAIGLLLKNRISGAPVVDDQKNFLGIFSEKTSMQVLISSAYEQLPTSRVEAFMNKDPQRVIDEDTSLLTIAQLFLDTPYRRLEVLRDGRLLGQISRRDVLQAEHHLSMYVHNYDDHLAKNSWMIPRSDVESQSDGEPLPSPEVSSFMDQNAHTTDEETDFLQIARIFLDTPYRRLPVLRETQLVGQISRCDMLRKAHDLMAVPTKKSDSTLLYLSSLIDSRDAPIQ
jgi:predicted transcriptional regulator